MAEWNRRSVVATGVALAAGSGIAATGAAGDDAPGAEDDTLPDPAIDPNPGLDEDWPSYDGGASHTRTVPDAHEFDGESLEAAWSVDHVGSVAVADETVYATTSESVVALEAADGSVVWETDDLVYARDPAVAGDSVYVSNEEVVALDRDDGSIRWTSDFDPEDRHALSRHTAAYDAVFVVVDGTLYALEADDGSIRWRLETVTDEDDEEYEFVSDVAAANGVVYAVTEGVQLALEPESGNEVWRTEERADWSSRPSRATETSVALGGPYYARTIRDAETGDAIEKANSEYIVIVLDDEMYVGGGSHSYYGQSYAADDEYSWSIDIHYSSVSTVITGETVYAYVDEAAHPPNAEYSADLVALDRYDGTVRWVRSADDAPVGPIRALSDETLYVTHEDELVALRAMDDDEDGSEDEDDDDGEDESGDDGDGGSGDDDDDGDSGDDDSRDEPSDDGDGGSDDGDDDSGDEPSDDGDDEGGDAGDDEDVSADDGEPGNETGDDGTGVGASDDDPAESVPGLTTGAGIVGGALGLEWLRRTSEADDRDG